MYPNNYLEIVSVNSRPKSSATIVTDTKPALSESLHPLRQTQWTPGSLPSPFPSTATLVQQETAAVFAASALAQQEATAPAPTAEPTSTHGRLVSGPR